MSTSSSVPSQKLSIYPSPPADVLLLDSPSALEQHIGVARRTATSHLNAAHAQVQGVVSRWIGVENRVEHRIKSLIPPPTEERILPGALYAAVAFLSGAILARHRALPIRALLPPALGLGAATHFLPRLSANVRAYAGDLEDEYAPELARVHETGKAHAAMGWARVVEATSGARASAEGAVTGVVGKVQEVTGLKLREALGVKAVEKEKKEEEKKLV
ncbi:MICOS complex subunit [Mycena kentingensis (nom. inval.)]|nr:MICOS complex subunit [Mycena kentingensis (nom. inval.)]